MHALQRNPGQTQSRKGGHQTAKSPASRHWQLPVAVAILCAIQLAVVLPTIADAQSWMKNLEDAGKRILDRTIDQGRPSEDQKSQQTSPVPQPASGSNPSYTRAQLREVQRILLDLGYKPGTVDGTYVPATATAIRAYQSDQGLPQTGAPSGELVAHLRKTQDAKLAGAAGAQTPPRSASTQQRPQQAGGMVAPAPEGAPITAAQERSPETSLGKSTRGAGPTETNASVSTVSSAGLEIDVLAPEGISIGMSFSEAKAALKARGYTNPPGEQGRPRPCLFDRPRGSGTSHTTVSVVARTKRDPYQSDCLEGEAVRVISIRYDVFDDKDPSLLRLVEVTESRLGSPADCGGRTNSRVGCRWNSPPNAPLVEQVSLDGGVARPMKKFRTMLTLQLHAKGDLKAQGRAPMPSSPANSQPDRSAASRQTDVGPTQSGVERSNERTEPTQKSTIASQKGLFEIEGAQLGMTNAQVSATLRAKGFVPSDGGRGAQFVNEGGKPHQAGSTTVTVSYLPGYKNGPPEQAQSLISRFTHSSRSLSDWQKVNEQIYQKLVVQYGEPDKCRRQARSSHDCTWVRQFDGWLATLDWQGTVSWATITLKASSVDRSKFSGLASITVASSSRVPPASSAPQSAQTSDKANGESATIGFDVLAPYGFSIGMPYSEVEAALKKIGFKGGDCGWYRSEDTRQLKLSFQSSGQPGTSFCGEGGLVKLIVVESSDSRGWAAPVDTIVASMNKQIGTAGKCNKPSKTAECRWESPPKPPLVREISVQLSPGAIYYRIRATENLQSRVNLPDKPAVRDEAQPWWTQDLAKMDAAAQTVKFTGSTRFEQLPPQEKQRLGGEATTVYEYCRKKDVFNSLHDCRCVAGKFIDARVANEQAQKTASIGQPPGVQQKWAPEWEKHQTARRDTTTELITIADRVAHQCPNKPGAADYGYKQCIKNGVYQRRLPDRNDLNAFCTCYADTFAAMYMNDPRSEWPNITGIGAGAQLECSKKGYPSSQRR